MKKITLMFIMVMFSICSYAQLPLEQFDTWPVGAGGWSTYQNDVGTNLQWELSPLNSTALPPRSPLHAAYMSRSNHPVGNPQDWLITKGFTVQPESELRFWSRLVANGDQGSRYDVLISTNPDPASGTFVSLVGPNGWGELEINPQQQQYTEKILPIPSSYAGQTVYIAFKLTTVNDGDRWLIDDVSCLPKCVAPSNAVATSPTITTANLSWNANGGTSWEIEVVGALETPQLSGTVYSGSLPYQPVLQSGTAYKYYVRTVCGPENYSEWVGPIYFTTVFEGATCVAPKVIAALPYSTTDNTSFYGDDYNGSPGASSGCGTSGNFLNGDDVVYKYTAAFTGNISINMSGNGPSSGMFVYTSCANIGVSCAAGGTGNATTPVNIPNFSVTAGQDYYIVISTSGSVQSTPYTLVIQQVNCAPPVGETTTGITESAALLSWTNPSNAVAWEVAVQPAGSPIPSGAGTVVFDNTNVPAESILPLTAGTSYQYYVRADCGNNTFSAWAGPYLFSTTLCAPANQCNYTFIMTDSFAGWDGNTMTIRQNGQVVAIIGETFTTGAGPETATVALCHGVPFELYWNSGGGYAYEVGVEVVNSFGQSLYKKLPGEGSQDSSLFSAMVDCLVPACLPPTGLYASNQGLTTANIGWAGAPTGSWEYIVVPAGDPAPTPATDGVDTTVNPAPVGNLTAATAYEFYVRVNCASGQTSGWAGPFQFNTSICEVADQCVYNFIMTDDYGGWEGNTMSIKQNGLTIATIGADFLDGTGPITVGVPLCNGIPFELHWNMGGSFAYEVGVQIVNPFNQTLYTKEPGEGEQGTLLYTGLVDCDNPACLPPTNVTTTNITDNSATISWDGPATGSWEYYLVPITDADPAINTPGTPITTNPFTITPLVQSTKYKVFIKQICAVGTPQWSAVHYFNTKVCPAAQQCNYSFVMTDLGYGYDGNTMTISQNGIPVATIGDTFTSGTGPVIVQVPLCVGVPFELFWNSGGSFASEVAIQILDPFGEDIYYKAPGEGSQNSLLYSDIAYCTPPSCPKPKNLNVTGVTQTSVNLGWDEEGTATVWEVAVLPPGSPAPSGTGTEVTSNPAPWGNLTSGTAYVFYVRANCGETDGYSTWSGPFRFTTMISNDECIDAISVPVNPGVECLQVVSGTVIGATGSPQSNTCLGDDDDDVWFEFVATAGTHAIELNNVQGSTTDLVHVLYSGVQCGNLTQMYCSDVNTSIANGLTPGNVYKIRVYSYSSNPESTTFEVCIKSPPPPISVAQNLTVEQLVRDVLIGSECAVISNITSSTGTNYGYPDGIGYFNKNNSAFPMNEGVVLVTGNAMNAVGYNDFPAGWANDYPGWPGDADLEEIMGMEPGDSNDATYIQFDFVPLINEVSFKFLFASEEYNQGLFECDFSDSFAFILTNLNTGESTNLAVLPGTDIPIQVTNIHPDNGVCGAANEEHFGQYNDNLYDPINFNGQTKIFTASSPVSTNAVYRIKLVIANEGDNSHNSAVFLLANSFQTGDLDLGLDLLVSTGNAVCAGSTVTLNSQLSPADYEFEWYLGTDLIPGANEATLVVTQPGEYKVKASYIGSTCSAESTVTVEFYDDVEDITGEPQNLAVCEASGFASFNFAPNTAAILGTLNPSDYTVTYHASLADAENNEGSLGTTYTNTVQNQQTIYVRIHDNASMCTAIKSFDLIVQDLTPEFTISENFSICNGETGTITVTPGNYTAVDGVTYTWTLDDAPLPDTGESVTVSAAGNYKVIINNSGCTAEATVAVAVTPVPVADAPVDVTECTSYILPALTSGNYYTETNGGGTMLAAGTEITTTQTLYVFATSGTTPACTDENEFTVNIVNVPISNPGNQEPCISYTLPVLPAGQAYYTAAGGPGGSGVQIAANTEITTDQTIYIYAESGTTPNCIQEQSFTVTITPLNVVTPGNISECDVYMLPALITGNYYTQPDGGGSQLAVGTEITQSQTLYVYAANGSCTDQDSFTVTITPTPLVSSTQGCEGGSYTLKLVYDNAAYSSENTTIEWNSPTGQSIGYEPNIVVRQTGNYTVTVTPDNGTCGYVLDVPVSETGCMIQKGISPNGDGLNDKFDLTSFGVSKLSIFNRYGREVYSYSNYTDQWYGQQSNGNELPTGTYFYSIERSNGENVTGWVYINREE